MNDQAKIERLLKFITLLSGSFGYSINEIAIKLDTTERTIYRYIETFRDAGFIIEKNSNGFWRLEKNDRQNRNLHDLLQFSEEESYLLQKAIHIIDDNNVLKSNLINKLYSLYDSKRVTDTILKKEKSEIVTNISEAILNKKQVEIIEYRSSNSSTVSNRVLEPVKFTTSFVSVWAYEPVSKSTKLFKTSRMQNVIILDKSWQFETEHNPGYIDCFRISSKKKIPVQLILSMRARNLLVEEYPLSEKNITETSDNIYIFDSEVCSFAGVGRFVLGMPDEIEIIKPPELKSYLNKKIENKKF